MRILFKCYWRNEKGSKYSGLAYGSIREEKLKESAKVMENSIRAGQEILKVIREEGGQ